MLVLTRRPTEKIVIDDDIIVEVLEVRGNRVRLGLIAPAEVSVRRPEAVRHPRALPELAAAGRG